MKQEIEIPDGYEVRIEGNRVIFELNESEDERIKKEIVDFIYWAINRGSITKEQRERSDSWLAYLEKQKEQNLEDIEDKAVRKYMKLDKFALANMLAERDKTNAEVIEVFESIEQQPVEWNEEKEQNAFELVIKEVTKDKESAIHFLKSAGIMDENGELDEKYRTTPLNSNETIEEKARIDEGFTKFMLNEQKSAVLSKEDEEMLDAMIDIVSNSLYEPLCPREGMLAWLKDLPNRLCHLTGGRERGYEQKNNESSLVGNKSKQFSIVNVDTSYMDCDQCDF